MDGNIDKVREALEEIIAGAGRQEDVSGIKPVMARLACKALIALSAEPAEEEWKEKVERRPEHCEGCSRNNSPVIMSICGGCYRLFRKDLFSPSANILSAEPAQDDGRGGK